MNNLTITKYMIYILILLLVSITITQASTVDYSLIRKSAKVLIQDEGFSSKCYKDSQGYWTIGYGFKLSKYTKEVITKQVAYEVLQIKLFEIDEDLTKYKYYRSLNQTQKVAVISMVYQLGMSGYKQFKHTIYALKIKKYSLATKHARNSEWCRQTKNRCRKISAMLSSNS